MTNELFTIYDSKAKAYISPFASPNNATAIREFARAANNKNHQFNMFPADFTLFHMGQFDDATGIMTQSKTKTDLGLALHFLDEPENLLHLKEVKSS